MFGDFLDRKQAFLNYKNIDLQKSQNLHLSKGVSSLFWPKFIMKFLYHFFLAKIMKFLYPFLLAKIDQEKEIS